MTRIDVDRVVVRLNGVPPERARAAVAGIRQELAARISAALNDPARQPGAPLGPGASGARLAANAGTAPVGAAVAEAVAGAVVHAARDRGAR